MFVKLCDRCGDEITGHNEVSVEINPKKIVIFKIDLKSITHKIGKFHFCSACLVDICNSFINQYLSRPENNYGKVISDPLEDREDD